MSFLKNTNKKHINNTLNKKCFLFLNFLYYQNYYIKIKTIIHTILAIINLFIDFD